ncbi:peptidoglycan-binding domain-containing protein [Rhodanobacter sp. L36]|uniref:peptidoglycan-binding domain-containing protein n=1 Tax=Rhodanobacter sp. L36 TaxID=1747221 RepID=UPI00131DCB4A|nr:peptidoglycan-binding domain-containing protein [Rhodanobacter sp. L36]
MPNLTDGELRAVAYYAIGVSTEGSDIAYKATYCGNTIHNRDGSIALEPIGNSGYTIGEMQTDLGAQPDVASELVNSFQDWAKVNHKDWVLSDQQQAQATSDLGRDGRHVRDPNYDANNHEYMEEHHGQHIPDSLLPVTGQDIESAFKAHLNDYLATEAGKSFVHGTDVKQVDNLMRNVAGRLNESDFYNNANMEDQAKIFATVAKSYNQGPAWTDKHIFKSIEDGKITSFDDISKAIDTYPRDRRHPDKPSYMETGRDAAISGAEAFNALRNASQANAMRGPWQAVMANPLVDPTQVDKDPKQLHLADQYATVKGLFVQPDQGRALVYALEKGGSHNYGDPSSSNSRGFYSEGNDFVQWDKNGQGRAFVDGQWSEFSRNEIALSYNKDHTLDINIARNGETHSLLHVVRPSGHSHSQPAAHHEAGVLRQGMHGEQVQKLQAQLGELGYLDNLRAPDGKFGAATRDAVKTFQHDHHLPEVGQAGPSTQRAVQADLQPLRQDGSGPLPSVSAMSSLAVGAPALDDPRNAFNPNYALYNELKTRVPDASDNRLLQFTAACHENKITAGNLGAIHFDRAGGQMSFQGSSMLATPATVDLKTPSPEPQQSIQHIQQQDQQQAQMMGQIQAQNAQANQQLPQGPMPGGPLH